MGTMADTDKLYTAADLAKLPDDGFRHELVRGFLVRDQAPGFEHGTIVVNLGSHLKAWAREKGAGYVTAEGGYKLQSDPDTVRVPDVTFVSYARLPQGKPTGFVDGGPDLAIEVVSPNDRMSTIVEKVGDYFEAGVEQVWVVVPNNRTVMIHRSLRDVAVLNENDTIKGDGILADLTLPVADIFE